MEGHYIVKLNSLCNANCLFCADTSESRRQPDPDFKSLISELEKNRKSFDSMIISGGEPTISPFLFQYIDHAKKIGFKHIAISTNGLLLYYPDFTKKLIRAGVEQFIVSFQAVDEKDYHAITGIKKSKELVAKGLENIQKYGALAAINTVIHKLNYKNLPEIVAYLIDNNAYNIQLSFMNPIGASLVRGRSTMAVRFTDALPYIKESMSIAKEKGYENIYLENIPICLVGEFKDKVADLKKASINKGYYNACKTKPDKCKGCSYFDECDGVWEAYLEQFGEREIVPKLKKPVKNE